MNLVELNVPDLGDFKDVTVVDVLATAGQRVGVDDALITLETEKASMDVPAAVAGVIERMHVSKGDRVSKGTLIATVRTEEIEQTTVVATPESVGDREQPYVETVTLADRPRASGSSGQKPAPTSKPGKQEAPKPAPRATDHAFDVVVLGAGPGGYTAAFRAADLGLRVALIERSPTLGGVCLNVGCIPSKALLHAARVIEEAHSMSEHGLGFGSPSIDRNKLRAWKGQVVTRLTNGLNVLAKQRKVEVTAGTRAIRRRQPYRGRAGRQAPCRGLQVLHHCERLGVSAAAGLARRSAHHGFHRCPGVAGEGQAPARESAAESSVSSWPAFTMRWAPKSPWWSLRTASCRAAIAISCARLKTHSRLATNRFCWARVYAAIEPLRNGLRVSFAGDKAPEPHLYDRVLVAVGRVPNGRNIGADRAGINVDERGFIRVDAQQRTNVENIFAIGDVVGPPMLAHKASHEGKVAAEVAAGQKRRFEARVIPSVAYTDPEIAWAGLTEIEAKQQGSSAARECFPWMASGRSLALNRDDGFTKLLFDRQSHRVLGAGIVGPNAGDLISEVALAIEMGCDAADIGLTIHPHPTLSETVAFAAEAYEGTLTDLYVPKK